jgi:predicted transcriptional regulator
LAKERHNVNTFKQLGEKMKTYIAVDQNGKTVTISAYTESEARQKAEEALGYGNVIEFSEI